MERPLVNLSHNTEARDIANDVAHVLEFITDTLCWIRPGEGADFSSDGTSGLYVILNSCIATLNRIQ